MLALGLPVFGVISEIEAVHWIFALLTILASGSIVWRAPNARVASFILPAGIGSSLIVAGLFAELVGLTEVVPTLLGAFLIAGAHLKRIKYHHTTNQGRFN